MAVRTPRREASEAPALPTPDLRLPSSRREGRKICCLGCPCLGHLVTDSLSKPIRGPGPHLALLAWGVGLIPAHTSLIKSHFPLLAGGPEINKTRFWEEDREGVRHTGGRGGVISPIESSRKRYLRMYLRLETG